MIFERLKMSDNATAHSTVKAPMTKAEWQMTNKPVVILPRLDHSSFCPGFQVPGDAFQAEAMAAISETVAAFLALHTDPSPATKEGAMAPLAEAKLAWTRDLLAPLATSSPPSRRPA